MNRHSDFPSPAAHPQSGREYSREDLEGLADQGDSWALGKLDDWDQYDAADYTGTRRDRCPDPSCALYGEPVTLCFGEDGQLLDIDHGGWGHYPPREQAKAS
ncbi:hypothetical protein [Arthrobacter sp.]|uniref:hypothetical protein n=1 Tax=Arthrobacter sp. TaxID=1667 RepID=UPI002896488D|nr:hypothetical protein [Arthrobacter sp.]